MLALSFFDLLSVWCLRWFDLAKTEIPGTRESSHTATKCGRPLWKKSANGIKGRQDCGKRARENSCVTLFLLVMPREGGHPRISFIGLKQKLVDGRNKSGHDALSLSAGFCLRRA
jgi:hypothetical protein